MSVRLLLDEHVSRVFERLLRERGYDSLQAKDQFGEYTTDRVLLEWCGEHGVPLITNNGRDFERLHNQVTHAGVLVYYEQTRPDNDPEGLARTVDEVCQQYGVSGIEDELVNLDEWYRLLHE